MNHSSSLCHLRLVLTFLLSFAGWSEAEIWRSEELNCSLDLPSSGGWENIPNPSAPIRAAARSVDNDMFISLSMTVLPSKEAADHEVERFPKRFLEKGAAKDQSEERIQINGRTAYRLKNFTDLGGKKAYGTFILVIDGARFFQIFAGGKSVDPMSDAAVRKCLSSFQFLAPAGSK